MTTVSLIIYKKHTNNDFFETEVCYMALITIKSLENNDNFKMNCKSRHYFGSILPNTMTYSSFYKLDTPTNHNLPPSSKNRPAKIIAGLF